MFDRTRCDPLTVGRYRTTRRRSTLTVERGDDAGGGDLPDPDHAVERRRRDVTAVAHRDARGQRGGLGDQIDSWLRIPARSRGFLRVRRAVSRESRELVRDLVP